MSRVACLAQLDAQKAESLARIPSLVFEAELRIRIADTVDLPMEDSPQRLAGLIQGEPDARRATEEPPLMVNMRSLVMAGHD